MVASILVAAGLAALAPQEIVLAQTPGRTVFSYVQGSISLRMAPEGEVRRVVILTRNPVHAGQGKGDQVAARGMMEFACAKHAYREIWTISIKGDRSETTVVPSNWDRRFANTRDGSFERQLVDAVCGEPA